MLNNTELSAKNIIVESNTSPSRSHKHDVSLRIYQTPVLELPDDLYVPPQAFAIWLEQFAGPLDFLLYLVKKNNVDLTQMPILPITKQYLAYINQLDHDYFELAGDYLLMASTLIAIKSELLLPKRQSPTDERDPKAELIERLEAYAQIKGASQRLDALVRLERDVFLALVSMPDQDIMQAELPSYSPNLLIESLFKMQLQPDYQLHAHTIKADNITLANRIASISRQLNGDGTRSFHQLLDKTQGKIGVIVSFVAILELMKRQLIGVVQVDNNTINNIKANELNLQWLA